MTNGPDSFEISCVIETDLSDFHKITITVMKTTNETLKPKITNYRDYKNFCDDRLRQILLEKLSTENTNVTCSRIE